MNEKINLSDTFNKASELLHDHKRISCSPMSFNSYDGMWNHREFLLKARFYVSPKITADATIIFFEDDFSPEHISLDETANIPDKIDLDTKLTLRVAFLLYKAYRKITSQENNNYKASDIDRLMEYNIEYDW